MKKISLFQKTNRNNKLVDSIAKSYKTYDLRKNQDMPLFAQNNQVAMRMSGIYGNFEKKEITNIYGVKFNKYSKVF